MGVQNMKRQLWLERIREQRQSGKTVVEYCRENGYSEKRYWYYFKRLGDELEEYRNKKLPIPVAPRFAELKPIENSETNTILTSAVIESATGRYRIRVEENISERFLMKILEAVNNA